ncbi:hypothetical protein SAY87_004884 [Trapa incisa]|uniref:Uncharacterized protein n=1 Tax=Trapa incisa TaxID=236973 RepID=A0AAN7JQD6_9MYRT|nr:hypothetical protein SAY87_004884 [Trapa incisa]
MLGDPPPATAELSPRSLGLCPRAKLLSLRKRSLHSASDLYPVNELVDVRGKLGLHKLPQVTFLVLGYGGRRQDAVDSEAGWSPLPISAAPTNPCARFVHPVFEASLGACFIGNLILNRIVLLSPVSRAATDRN